MVDAVGRQDVRRQEIESISLQPVVARINGEDLEFDAGLQQSAHVSLEERRNPRGILAREHGQSHSMLPPLHQVNPNSWSHSSRASSMKTR